MQIIPRLIVGDSPWNNWNSQRSAPAMCAHCSWDGWGGVARAKQGRSQLSLNSASWEHTQSLSRLNKQLLIILKNSQMFSLYPSQKQKSGGGCQPVLFPLGWIRGEPVWLRPQRPTRSMSILSDTFHRRSITVAIQVLLKCCGHQPRSLQPIRGRH